MSLDVLAFFEEISRKDVILAYKGDINTEVINNVLDQVENKLQEVNEDGKIRKKIYNVLVESLQNLYHHVDDVPDDFREQQANRFGIMVMKREEASYRVITGNFILNDKIPYLKEKLDKINSLSKDELKELYKFILNHQKLSAKGGGGLGLVDIARKTGNKLDYVFHDYNKLYSFFNLNIVINQNKPL